MSSKSRRASYRPTDILQWGFAACTTFLAWLLYPFICRPSLIRRAARVLEAQQSYKLPEGPAWPIGFDSPSLRYDRFRIARASWSSSLLPQVEVSRLLACAASSRVWRSCSVNRKRRKVVRRSSVRFFGLPRIPTVYPQKYFRQEAFFLLTCGYSVDTINTDLGDTAKKKKPLVRTANSSQGRVTTGFRQKQP